MLLDEPSNHLDLRATEWLEEFLRTTTAAVILVSHDRYFLDRVTNRTLELYFGTVDDYPGNFTKYLTLKEDRLLVQSRTYEKYVEEVEKAKDFIRRHHYGMKAAQAEDRRKKLEHLEANPAELPRNIQTPSFSFPKPSRTGDIVFRVEELTKGFSGRPLFKDLTFTIQQGERWAIIGPNGCGKTTLLKCLIGELAPNHGRVKIGQGVKIGYFDQHLHVLDDSIPVVEAIRPVGKVFEELPRRKLLGAFGLTQDQQIQNVGSLSGGQRCRAALAKLAAEDANVLVLDEPTNHLDLWARSALEKALKNFGGTVLFISHDRYFVDRTADHLLIIQPNARFLVLEGNYTTFRDMVAKSLIADPFLDGALATGAVGPIGETSASKRAEMKRTTEKAHIKPSDKERVEKPLSDRHSSERIRKERAGETGKKSIHDTLGKHPSKQKKKKKQRKFPIERSAIWEEEIFVRETRVMTLNEELVNPETLRDGDLVRCLTAELSRNRSFSRRFTNIGKKQPSSTEAARCVNLKENSCFGGNHVAVVRKSYVWHFR